MTKTVNILYTVLPKVASLFTAFGNRFLVLPAEKRRRRSSKYRLKDLKTVHRPFREKMTRYGIDSAVTVDEKDGSQKMMDR